LTLLTGVIFIGNACTKIPLWYWQYVPGMGQFVDSFYFINVKKLWLVLLHEFEKIEQES
jgi:hypothetical protein